MSRSNDPIEKLFFTKKIDEARVKALTLYSKEYTTKFTVRLRNLKHMSQDDFASEANFTILNAVEGFAKKQMMVIIPGTFRIYLLSCYKNRCMHISMEYTNKYKKFELIPANEIEKFMKEPDKYRLDDGLESKELCELALKIIDGIEENDKKTILLLYILKEMKCSDIAEEIEALFGVRYTVNHINIITFRFREALKKAYEELHGEMDTLDEHNARISRYRGIRRSTLVSRSRKL